VHIRRGCNEREIDGWIARMDELDDDVDRAWTVLGEARESGRLNPRRAVATRMQAAEDFVPILTRLTQAVAETRSMARTIRLVGVPAEHWDNGFREPWLDLLRRSGTAIAEADIRAITEVRADLTAFANRLDVDGLQDDRWAVYGALVVNLRNVLDALDLVAEAQPVKVPAPAISA